MLAYSVILFAVAACCGLLGLLIFHGHIELIHEYHRTQVQDVRRYAKDMGRAMLGLSAVQVLSAVIGLFGDSRRIVGLSVGVLLLGLIVSFVHLLRIQKRHNGGLF